MVPFYLLNIFYSSLFKLLHQKSNFSWWPISTWPKEGRTQFISTMHLYYLILLFNNLESTLDEPLLSIVYFVNSFAICDTVFFNFIFVLIDANFRKIYNWDRFHAFQFSWKLFMKILKTTICSYIHQAMYSVNSEVGDNTSCTIFLLMHYYSAKCQRQHCLSSRTWAELRSVSCSGQWRLCSSKKQRHVRAADTQTTKASYNGIRA